MGNTGGSSGRSTGYAAPSSSSGTKYAPRVKLNRRAPNPPVDATEARSKVLEAAEARMKKATPADVGKAKRDRNLEILFGGGGTCPKEPYFNPSESKSKTLEEFKLDPDVQDAMTQVFELLNSNPADVSLWILPLN